MMERAQIVFHVLKVRKGSRLEHVIRTVPVVMDAEKLSTQFSLKKLRQKTHSGGQRASELPADISTAHIKDDRRRLI